MSTNNPYPGLETTGPKVSALVCFRGLAHSDILEKVLAFRDLVGRMPKITIRGDAYDEQGNLVFVTGNYYEVRDYMSDALAVSINGLLTWVHPKDTWDAVAMS
jgi:hypothetical protein